jgi:hypothetical protein
LERTEINLNRDKGAQMNSTQAKLITVVALLSLTAGLVLHNGAAAVALQATSSEKTPGGKCKVTKGPNKGKTGTYSDDGWCEGDWGGTECGDSNDKCEDVASGPETVGVVAIYDGDLTKVMKRSDLGKSLPTVETKIVGAARLARADSRYVEVADRNCKAWKSISGNRIMTTRVLSLPAIACGGESYPVLSIQLNGSEGADNGSRGDGGPTVVSYARLSRFVRLPRLVVGGAFSDGDWDRCVDIYLDCQIDCQSDGGGVWGSVDSCLSHCDAVFDACTFDPF